MIHMCTGGLRKRRWDVMVFFAIHLQLYLQVHVRRWMCNGGIDIRRSRLTTLKQHSYCTVTCDDTEPGCFSFALTKEMVYSVLPHVASVNLLVMRSDRWKVVMKGEATVWKNKAVKTQQPQATSQPSPFSYMYDLTAQPTQPFATPNIHARSSQQHWHCNTSIVALLGPAPSGHYACVIMIQSSELRSVAVRRGAVADLCCFLHFHWKAVYAYPVAVVYKYMDAYQPPLMGELYSSQLHRSCKVLRVRNNTPIGHGPRLEHAVHICSGCGHTEAASVGTRNNLG